MTQGLMAGKRGLILGLANKRSIAWASALSLVREGAELALTYQGERLRENAEDLAQSLPVRPKLLSCDVSEPNQIEQAFATLAKEWTHIDFLVHSVAYADADDLKDSYVKTSLKGFQTALSVSAYSLVEVVKYAQPLLSKAPQGASVVTMTYLGSTRVIPRYNVMGVAKAALEASVRYLANDLGPSNIRVNAISAGPLNTLAARGIHGFGEILKHVESRSPLRRNIDATEVGDTCLFLSSHLARGVTGVTLFVDAGYHIMGF